MSRGMNGIDPNTIVAPDLASPQFKADPYPFYAPARRGPRAAHDAARPAGGVAGDAIAYGALWGDLSSPVSKPFRR